MYDYYLHERGVGMDIAETSMSLAASETVRSFGIGMLRKSMDQMEQMGEQMAQMMDEMGKAAGIGNNVDIRV